MTKGQDYMARAYFIESTVDRFLKHKKDFDYIRYTRSKHTDGEYIRIADMQGRAITLDITARSLEDIAEDIARIILIGKEKIAPPDNIITDPSKLRIVSMLFK